MQNKVRCAVRSSC